ncbi:hypothetical protein B9T30_09035 [Acinetobacter sp. ANC 4973]|nr:hypothetical protein B9T30_09035 [Acinetobacter sp. ANC 4973]
MLIKKGLLIFQPCIALFAKTTQTRHEMQTMVTPLLNFITKFGGVLVITLRDRDIFAATALSCAALVTAHHLE